MLVDLIVCDLVPLRKRGSVMGIIFGAVTMGTALGTFIGGVLVETTTWRCLKYEKKTTLIGMVKRIDLIGNAIFVLATTSKIVDIINGGTRYPWSSWNVILPLVLGVFGLGSFTFSRWSWFSYSDVVTYMVCPATVIEYDSLESRTKLCVSQFSLLFYGLRERLPALVP